MTKNILLVSISLGFIHLGIEHYLLSSTYKFGVIYVAYFYIYLILISLLYNYGGLFLARVLSIEKSQSFLLLGFFKMLISVVFILLLLHQSSLERRIGLLHTIFPYFIVVFTTVFSTVKSLNNNSIEKKN